MRGRQKIVQDDDKNVTIRIPQDLLLRLDECRRLERDIPNRSEMIRRLLIEQLDVRGVPQPRLE